MRIINWLKDQGLSAFEEAFVRHGIDASVLRDLTLADLTDMGITAVGPRRKLLTAISNLTDADIAFLSGGEDGVGSAASDTIILCCKMRALVSGAPEFSLDRAKSLGASSVQMDGDTALLCFAPKASGKTPAASALDAAQSLVTQGDACPASKASVIHSGPGPMAEAFSRAKQLCLTAPKGSIVLDQTVKQNLSTEIALDPLAFVNLDGLASGVTVWSNSGRATPDGRPVFARAGHLSRFIGRDDHLQRLSALCPSTGDASGAVATLRGEPGIGKSRLVLELAQRAEDAGMQVQSWYCSPGEATTAYAPIIGHFQMRANLAEASAPLFALSAALEESASPRDEVLALFARLLGVEDPSDLLNAYSPPRLRQRTSEVIIEQLIASAAQQPLLLIIEDYHWIDPSTAEVLEALVPLCDSNPIFILTTFRDQIDDPWQAQDTATRIVLDRISESEASAIIQRASEGNPLTDAQVSNIIANSGGVPLFVEELTRAAVDHGNALPDQQIPQTLQEALLARVSRLPSAQKITQLAALLGRDFDAELVARAANETADQTETALQAMQDAHILAPSDPAGSRKTFRFAHALIRDALVEQLPTETRKGLHLQIAATLAADVEAGQDHPPEQIAAQFDHGGEPMAAMGWYITAGQNCLQRFANKEAVGHFNKALDLSEAAPAPEVKASAELGISGLKGVALTMLNGWAAPQVGEVYKRAYELWSVAGGGYDTFPTAFGLISYSIVRGDLDVARQMCVNALRIAEGSQNREWLMAIEAEYGSLMLYLGDLPAGAKRMERALAVHDPETHVGHMQFTGKNQEIFATDHIAMMYATQGRAKESITLAQDAQMRAQRLRNAFSEAFGNLGPAACHTILHDAKSTLKTIDHPLRYGQQEGFPHIIAQAMCMKGWALAMQGKFEQAMPLLGEGTGMWRGMGARLRLPHYLALYAEALCAARELEHGLDVINEALSVSSQTQEMFQEADSLRIKADLLSALGDKGSQAEHVYKLAIAVSRRTGTHAYTWRAQAHLGKHMIVTGDAAGGRALIDEAKANFKKAGMRWAVADANALLKVAAE